MKVIPCGQMADGPADKPTVIDPVHAILDVPIYYFTQRGPVLTSRTLFCARLFSSTVLTVMEQWCEKYHFALVHLGLYFPRFARHADGTPILPQRWSNHAFACALDTKGMLTKQDDPDSLIVMSDMKIHAPEKYNELVDGCQAAIVKAGHKPEIVDEGNNLWLHIGLFPPE